MHLYQLFLMDATPTQTNTTVPTQGGPIRRDQTGTRVSRIVFTLNNWTQPEYDYLTQEFAPQVTWMVIGKETGESGTQHLQGNCVFERFGVCHCDLCLQ